jgi:PAS domain S-box-containing protein
MPTTASKRPEDVGLVDALRQSEERYRFLTESVPVQIWTATPDGKLDYVSEQTARRLGSTPSQVLAEGWKNFVHPEDLPGAVERWIHSLETGETYEVEFRLAVGTGKYAWHLARAVPRRGPTGAIVQWFGTNTDIEAQRSQQDRVKGLLEEVAHQATRLSEQNHLLALEADVGAALVQGGSLEEALTACAGLVVKHLDAAFARIWTVDGAGKVLELRASAGLYTHIDGPHGRVPIGQFKIGQIAAEKKPQVTNQVVGDPDVGDQAWAVREGMVAFAGYPLVIGETLVGVIAAFARRPLSAAALTVLGSVANGLAQAIDRRRTEEAIRISEQWLSTTLLSIGDGVITTDGQGHVTFLNDVAATLTGWTVLDAIGQPVEHVFCTIDEHTGRPIESRHSQPLGLASDSVARSLLRQRTGNDVWVEVSAAPIRDRRGSLSGAVLVLRDATEKARVDAERVHLLAEAQNGREDAEKQRRAAELASRAKDEFLATASHELRTPLNSILGWARLMRGNKLDAQGFQRGVETIERNAKAQVQLIEDILDGSRIITGNLHLEIQSVDLAAIVRTAADSIRAAASAKEIRLDMVVIDSQLMLLKGDPDRLQQVVWNLVNNAIKFTPKKGNVEIRVERVGTQIQLSVKDSGQGIPAEFLPHVFERFRQVDGSTTRRHGGLGLGLALVRHLVEAHGGTVRAESRGEGQGATFTALLPVQAVHMVDSVRRAPPGSPVPARRSISELQGVRVLVIDDEPDARELVATVLRGHGAEVFVAESVERALELLVVHSPTLLVSDIGMPVTDGYGLIERVRAIAPRIPAIALTAYAREEDRRRALRAGFQTYLAKPVEPEALARAVGELARSSTTMA